MPAADAPTRRAPKPFSNENPAGIARELADAKAVAAALEARMDAAEMVIFAYEDMLALPPSRRKAAERRIVAAREKWGASRTAHADVLEASDVPR